MRRHFIAEILSRQPQLNRYTSVNAAKHDFKSVGVVQISLLEPNFTRRHRHHSRRRNSSNNMINNNCLSRIYGEGLIVEFLNGLSQTNKLIRFFYRSSLCCCFYTKLWSDVRKTKVIPNPLWRSQYLDLNIYRHSRLLLNASLLISYLARLCVLTKLWRMFENQQ